MTGTEELLEQELDELREQVTALEHDLDALIAHEEDNAARDEVLSFLREKREHRELLQESEQVEFLLRHLEEAYRTAAISEETYQKAKQSTKALLQ